MVQPLRKTLLSILFLISAISAFSQTGQLPGADEKIKPGDKSNDGSSSIKFGVNYSNNNVFMGRTDTIRTPTIVPQIKYTLKSGIYFSGSIDVIPGKKKKKLDGGNLTAGYDFDITDDLSAGASYSRLFYNKSSTQIASSVSNTFNADLSYDFGEILTAEVSADYNINKQHIGSDAFINLSLTHDFIVDGIFGDSDLLLISPTVTANTGTQNFYDAYLITKNFKNAKRTAAQNKLVTQYTGQLSKYKLLDYELSAPFEYKSAPFIFQFTPTYALVQNQLPKQIASQISDKTSIFYFEIGVAVKF
ncbi:MAG: hypothetical protein M3O71_25855 [Bacteroidota bacterium]|nr:hypothetical protein [Bacteroidota bacterium]